MKFAVMSSSNTNKYYPYDTVKKTIVNKLKENPTYTDVAAAIQELEPLDMTNLEPVRKLSTIDPFDTEEDGTMTLNQRKEHQRKIAQEGFDIDYEKSKDIWNKRECEYKNGMISAYSKILNNYVMDHLRGKVEQLENFESKIENDPIKLFIALEILSHDGITVQY